MDRVLERELLDELSPENPGAIQSRRDLRKLNLGMGHVAMMARALRMHWKTPSPGTIIELGAGDGYFLLKVAGRLCKHWPAMHLTMVDRVAIVPPKTIAAFTRLGWKAESHTADVFQWLQESRAQCDVIVANLFLHHFSETQLDELMLQSALRCKLFVALEPQRAFWPRQFCRILWALGCNRVTRHDAPVSVRAGFANRELAERWPAKNGEWSIHERAAGLFSHLFVARHVSK